MPPAPVPTAAIQFLTANEGWGVGTPFDPGAILETIDGGRTWSVVFSVPGAAFSDIRFANSSNGWVAGATQPWDPHSSQGLLWRTTDGGQSWSPVPATMRLPALPAIAFSGGGRGALIAPGAAIACSSACPAADEFATTDGGKLWRSVVPVVHPGGLTAVDITPVGTFWGLWRTAGNCNLVLARSTAAASGWTVSGCSRGVFLPVPPDEEGVREFCIKNGVGELALFVSVLRADFGPGSDVDMLVWFLPGKRVSLIDLCRREAELAPLVGGRAVDLRTVGDLHPSIRPGVLSRREVIYSAVGE